jgi:thiamine pyrophosphate-dependent acetolactate synthase large subunit-like protein
MAKTAADILIERLIKWDVEVIFGLPGDCINGIMGLSENPKKLIETKNLVK